MTHKPSDAALSDSAETVAQDEAEHPSEDHPTSDAVPLGDSPPRTGFRSTHFSLGLPRTRPALDLSGMLPRIDVSAFIPPLNLNSVFGSHHVSASLGLANTIAGTFTLGDVFGSTITTRALSGVRADIAAAIAGAGAGAGAVVPNLASTLLQGLPNFADIARAVYPDNLIEADIDFDKTALETWMADEALPVAWVPRSSTIEAIYAAGSPARRRLVYGRRWRSVLADCESRLQDVSSVEVSPYATYAFKVVDGIRDGHPELAQAFAANTLDTVAKRWLDRRTKDSVTSPKEQVRRNLGDYEATRFFAYAQLRGVYQKYQVEHGDPIPGTFSRHASAHGVSRTQYSRINAVLGAAHLTSFLWAHELLFRRARR
jgi:hypothetical protein